MSDVDEVPDTGSVRGDLRVLLEQLVAFLGRSDAGRVLPSLIDAAERDAELAELRKLHIAQRRGTFEHVLRAGIARGELAPDTDLDLLIDLLAGPFFYRRLVARRRVAVTDIEPVLDLVLCAVGVVPAEV
jgi:hypothetical protein